MSIRILVVDDEVLLASLFQQRFRRRIQSGEYTFRFATGGREALTILSEDPEVDVLLFDINMPDMDGLTLLELTAGLIPDARAVMVSAYGDMPNIRLAMNRGAFDFITKPIDFQDLERTIDKTAAVVQALRESTRIKALAELKARFFDNLTHEFRTPLSLILAPAAALLQRPELDEATRGQLGGIRRNAEELSILIDQLLDLARLEEDRLPIEESVQDIPLFVSELVEAFRPICPTIRFQTDREALEAAFDAGKWRKILNNLLSNAVRFTPEGGMLDIRCQFSEETVHICVADSGPGIPETELPFVFDRFHRADTRHAGSGIGLSLAYELTRLLKGSLSAQSRPGAGTTFTAVLPFRAENPAPPDVLVSTNPFHPTSYPSGNPLILIAEDNPELRRYLSDLLGKEYTVLTASDGRTALEIARRELPDVVLSDVRMPGMDGFRLTRLLRTHPATDHIAVMLLTALASVDHLLEGLSEGADEYLIKPFRPEELSLRLRNLLNRQEKLRTRYRESVGQAAPTGTKTPDTFLHRLAAVIEQHLDDPDFRAETLAEEVAMSPRTLTRKLSMVADISPARLIRTHRLRRAGEMLRSGASVADAAYAVGFENPSYFATAFREYYGRTPTDFARGQ